MDMSILAIITIYLLIGFGSATVFVYHEERLDFEDDGGPLFMLFVFWPIAWLLLGVVLFLEWVSTLKAKRRDKNQKALGTIAK
jgi:uncharacterized membrane protein